jgi:cytochrome c-type biogenesis protein CcmH/NrfF
MVDMMNKPRKHIKKGRKDQMIIQHFDLKIWGDFACFSRPEMTNLGVLFVPSSLIANGSTV